MAGTRALGEPGAVTAEELTRFHRWRAVLPCAVSSEVERTAVYVRSRHMGNPQFFEQTRRALAAILGDCSLLSAMRMEAGSSAGAADAFETLLQAQLTALGFLCNQQFHKALTLGEMCTEVSDSLTGGECGDALFWRVLSRAVLGDAYARFRKHEEARAVLAQGVGLVAEAGESAGPKERVLLAACHSHLARLELEAGAAAAAAGAAALAVDLLERFALQLSDLREDRETAATVLATAYSLRGACEAAQRRFDEALSWQEKAIECVTRNADLSVDCTHMRQKLESEMEHIKSLRI